MSTQKNTDNKIFESIENALRTGNLKQAEKILGNKKNKSMLDENRSLAEIYHILVLINKSDFDIALRRIKALQKKDTIETEETRAGISILKAYLHQTLGQSSASIAELNDLQDKLEPESQIKPSVMFNLASVWKSRGEFAKADACLKSLVNGSGKMPELITKSALALAKTYSDLDHAELQKYTDTVLKTASRYGGWDDYKLAEILNSYNDFREGHYTRALRQLHRHMREADESNFIVSKIRVRLALADAFITLGDYASAKDILLELEDILSCLQFSELKYYQYHAEYLWYLMGIRSNDSKDVLLEALDRLEIVLAVIAKYPRTPGPAIFWLLIGEIQLKLGMTDLGIRSLERGTAEAASMISNSISAKAVYLVAFNKWEILKQAKQPPGIEKNKILADTAAALESLVALKRPEIEWRLHFLRSQIFESSGENYPAKEEQKIAAQIVYNLYSSIENPSLLKLYKNTPDHRNAFKTLQPFFKSLETKETAGEETQSIKASQTISESVVFSKRNTLKDVLKAMFELHSSKTITALLDILMQNSLQTVNGDRAMVILDPLNKDLDKNRIKTRTDSNNQPESLVFPKKWVVEAAASTRILTYSWDVSDANPDARHVLMAPIKRKNTDKVLLCLDRLKSKGEFREEELAIISTLTSVAAIVLSLLSIQEKLKELADQFRREIIPEFPHIVGKSEEMKKVFVQMQRIAPSDIPVLIQGETGTGKDIVARTIHDISNRSKAPFVHLDCSAIPITLLESELFGIEEGIATGVASRVGIIEYANGGTILLDEAGDIPLSTQAKLLRVLQEQEFVPVGSDTTVSVNIRIIATSTANVQTLIDDGKMREDFFYRISGLIIQLPPLRKRQGDIVLLARTFLQRYNKEFGKEIIGFKPELFDAMLAYQWPGNVRELDHMVRKAVLFCHNKRISFEDMSFTKSDYEELSLDQMIKRMEREYVNEVLQTFDNDQVKTAAALKISVPQLANYLDHDFRAEIAKSDIQGK